MATDLELLVSTAASVAAASAAAGRAIQRIGTAPPPLS